jgi:hypothetical protein
MSILLLPFTLRSHHVFLDARVNDVPATLVLDTGSGMCALDAEWARSLDLEHGATNGQAVGTESMSISIARIDSLILGDAVELRDEPAALVPLRDVSARHGQVVHGTIGFGFFMKFVVEVDYASCVLRLHDPATFAYDGSGERIPIDLSKRVPMLQAALVANREIIPARLLLDLGTGGYASVLTKTFVDRHAELLTAGHCRERLIGTGVGGSAQGFVTTLDEMRLGNLRVPNPYVAIPADSRGFFGMTWVDGTLGAPVLSRTRLILDYVHQEVIIEPVGAMDAPFAIDQSGLSFRAEGPELDTVVIDEVAAGSPAARAGIAVGDILRGVNGHAISGQSIDWVAEMFTQTGAIHSLRVEHEVPLTLQ